MPIRPEFRKYLRPSASPSTPRLTSSNVRSVSARGRQSTKWRSKPMNVAKIEMDPQVAQAKLAAYRRAMEGRHPREAEEEYRAAIDAYKELAKGTPLIDPFQAIRECGWRPDARPVLAIARADQKMVRFSISRDSRRWNAGTWRGPWCPMTWQFTASMSWRSRQTSANLTFEV